MSGIAVPLRRHIAAVRAMLVFTVLCGMIYPLLMTGVAQAVFKDKADGSLIKNSKGQIVGSSLLCQEYVDAKGNALPQYFQSRPSAATNSANSSDPGCDYQWSGGSNLATSSPALKATIEGRITAYASAYHVDPSEVPQDAVTASGSGMDPDISVANADIQAPFVAKARNVDVSVVDALIAKNTTGRDLGFLGEEGVNVTMLNLALDNM